MMPGKNGVDSFLEIREQRPDAKVYFMTGYSADDLLKKAMAGGALGVFDKPVDLPRVLDVCAADCLAFRLRPFEGSCRQHR